MQPRKRLFLKTPIVITPGRQSGALTSMTRATWRLALLIKHSGPSTGPARASRSGARRPLLCSALQPIRASLGATAVMHRPPSLMDSRSPRTLPDNPFSWRPPAAPTPAGGPPPRWMLTDPPCLGEHLALLVPSLDPRKATTKSTAHRRSPEPPSTATTWQAHSALERWPGCPSVRAAVLGHGPRSQGQDRTRRAPLNPQHLRTPPGPISPATTSDSQGDRALRPGAQTLRAGERWLVGCRQAHRWSPGPVRTCVPREALTRKGGLGEDGVAPGWQDSAQRGSEGHAACLPGGEGGPSPQPSPGACAGQGSCTLQGDSGCGVGVPTAGAQTMLSTNTGEGVWRQRARAPRAWPTHQRDPGG